ncbi:hypothetical protein LZZ85_12575 [Terrimonas sp. NA20]|uniref:Uncharacterized protein n=1 Tax=Terrimonas ginsenosidimutans TaxID=2908004 RepID=A0ABS9KS31_9BACT|nr:hypothetical protein [Terrimonas ginsenosidimutans]MCG2615126.1 hypothetical protein [Terrimonas ginsenosidimutans]
MHKRLIQITLVIKAYPVMQEYNFTKRTELLYDVNIDDENGQRCYFSLVKDKDYWQIGPELLLPNWVSENESDLLSAFHSVENMELIGQFYNN